MGGTGDWWRPTPGSKWEQRLSFIGIVVAILTGALGLAGLTWTVLGSDDQRLQALLWWAFVVSAAGGYVIFALRRREHREVRFARALDSLHLAHHHLRDAAFQRYILEADESTWKAEVAESLRHFAACFTVASGSSCHATIKTLSDPSGERGRSAPADELVVGDFERSASRPVTMRSGIPANNVGRNTDFRKLFSVDGGDNRCWYHHDLLELGEHYDNPHWPERPTRRNVPYRATMVWPIRKVLREGTPVSQEELYIHGFLTVDTKEPGAFQYERHFHLGAAYADHLMTVLWDPHRLEQLTEALSTNHATPTTAQGADAP